MDMPENRHLLSCLNQDRFTATDLVKMIVLSSFAGVSLMLTAVAPVNLSTPCTLVYCVPILLAALWFPLQALHVTVILVTGFVLGQTSLSLLGYRVAPLLVGLHALLFFWVFGAVTLFSQDSYLAASRCRKIIENSRDAKFLCEPGSLRVVCASKLFAAMLGYSPTEVVGISLEEFWPDESDRASFIQEMNKEGYIVNIETIFYTKDGESRRVLLSGRPLAGEDLFECSVVDCGRFRDENGDLLRSDSRLNEFVRQTNDMFFMQDTSGRILHFFWARAPEYGLDPDKLAGRDLGAILPEDLARQHMAQVRKVIDERKDVRYSLNLMIGGLRHTFSVSLCPYTASDGVLRGVIGSARDVTESRRQRLACRQLSWEVDRWKHLTTTISHEMRTPLQPLIGYLQLVLDDPEYYGITPETESILKVCLDCAIQEQAVVERAVELSVFATDYIDLNIQDIALRDLVDSVIASGGYGREALIRNEIPDDVHMPGDAGRLAVALESLISNAVRYNDPPKGVWIRYRESPENHYIMVCDNGRGIPKEKIRSIFDPFYIGDACDQDKKGGGVGLSLSIANRYVRLHGGEITVASQVGEGSTFTIRIPKEV